MSQELADRVNGVAQEDIDRLEAQVQHQLSGRLLDFRLKRQDKGVILMGRAGCYYTKRLAQHTIMRVTDPTILQNEIEVS